MLKIIDFTENHIERAINIAKENYENERKFIKILPEINEYPDFTPFVENELGVSAFIGDKMVGYLCCYNPFENAFGTTNAAKKWVNLRATNHAITFYAHNNLIQNQLYRYGFGLRCLDTIREMKEIEISNNSKYDISELKHNEFHLIFQMGLLLDEHLAKSPIFMRRAQYKIDDLFIK